MSATVQQVVPKLCANEVWALYGGELEYCLGSDEVEEEQEPEDFERHSECSDRPASAHGPCSPPAEEYEHLGEDTQGTQACLPSTRDYYSQLEALKRLHLQDMADLEDKYVSDLRTRKGKEYQGLYLNNKEETDSAQKESEALPGGRETGTVPQQELESVSECDTPERWGRVGEKEKMEEEEEEEMKRKEEEEEEEEVAAERLSRQSSTDGDKAQSLKPDVPEPEPLAISKQQSKAPSRRSSPGAERSGRSINRLVTVPKPFKMMLREEDKKRRNVKTRSEVELENDLLRRELEEMRRCRRKFRATPAPPSTRLPSSEVISVGCNQRRSRPTSLDRSSNSSTGSTRRRLRSSSSSSRSRNTSPQPFSFLERERKKREQKLEEALRSGLTSHEDHWVFKARPLPRMYTRTDTEEYQLYGATETHSRDQHQKQHHLQHCENPANSDLLKRAEQRLQRERCCIGAAIGGSEQKAEETDPRATLDSGNWRLRRKPSLGGKGLLVEGESDGLMKVRERDWSYIHPIQRTCISLNLASSFSVSQERAPVGKSDYISV